MPEKNSLSDPPFYSRDRVTEAVRQIFAGYTDRPLDEIQENHDLEVDLGLDSLDKVEIMMEIEEDFDISVSDEITDGTRTVGDVIEGVSKLLQNTPSQV